MRIIILFLKFIGVFRDSLSNRNNQSKYEKALGMH